MKKVAALLLATLLATTGSARPKPVYLGCHKFCRVTGEYGAPGEHHLVDPARSPDTGLHLDDEDMTFPVTVTCTYFHTCRGAILLWPDERYGGLPELGRSDLLVPAKSTLTIAVQAYPSGVARMELDGKLDVDLILDLGDGSCPDDRKFRCQVYKDVTAYPS